MFLWDEKQPYLTRLKSKQLFGIAGIFAINEHYNPPLVSFALLTTEANNATWHIHERTCVIIKPEDETDYLEPTTPLEEVLPMLEAYSEDEIEVIKVSPRLNRSTDNSSSFIQRYEEGGEEQKQDTRSSTDQLSFFD